MPERKQLPEETKNYLPELSDQQLERIMQFEGLGPVADTFLNEGWSPQEEIRTILDIIRDPEEKNSTKLTAMRMLRSTVHQIMEDTGMLAKAERTRTNPDGSRDTLSTSLVAQAMNMGKEAQPENDLETQQPKPENENLEERKQDEQKDEENQKETEESQPEVPPESSDDTGSKDEQSGTTYVRDTRREEAQQRARERKKEAKDVERTESESDTVALSQRPHGKKHIGGLAGR